MKLAAISLLITSAVAFPLLEQREDTCKLTGINGDVPTQVRTSAFKTVAGSSTPEACRALCFRAENAGCKSFGIRQSGGGSCLLFDTDISLSVIPRESVYTYFTLPAGIVGAVPENVAQHYTSDITKTKGNYAGCRGLCLSDSRCKGFGYKEGGNCQIQYQVDCTT
ncbi:hypothetical protein BKA63DRAFT_518271 [Paraphoma chrysanthemicola]|nr:hypothetical protein BKA63DRAFT_518271 [Paraphoma chrysanthemicola]